MMDRNQLTPADLDKKYKRNYKACLNCRTRKVKCDLGSVDEPTPPCVRCKRERKECVFADSRRGGSNPGTRKRKLEEDNDPSLDIQQPLLQRQSQPTTSILPPLFNDRIPSASPIQHTQLPQPNTSSYRESVTFPPPPPVQRQEQQHRYNNHNHNYNHNHNHPQQQQHHHRHKSSMSVESRTSHSSPSLHEENLIPPPRPSEFATMQGALVFLARAAGTIAKADDRDNLNAREIHERLENQESASSSAKNSPMVNNMDSRQNSTSDYDFAPLIRPHGKASVSLPPVEHAASVHPLPTKKLSEIPYIGNGKMLTESEAEYLINLFFLTMHPFFPHIPQQLHSPQILAGYPILLCSILTISARYHSFENDNTAQVNKNSRNIQLHERLWIYCQRLISQTVWAEASTRSIGTALAFLLFTEWNPRAIHWRWSDYANDPVFKDDMSQEGPSKPSTDYDEGLAGLTAMRRSDRMAWMLVGTSVRLSQDMGFITESPEIFVATHIAETTTAMNLGQRSMLAQSLGEVDLDKEIDDDISGNKKYQYDEFILSMDEETMRRRSLQKKQLKFTFSQKAKLELLKIMSLAYETIYCGNYQIDGMHPRQNLTVLSVLSPLIENWYKTYKKLLKPSNPKNFNHHCNLRNAGNSKHVQEITKQMDKESIICDYYYCQLYIYSLALSVGNPLNTNFSDANKPLNNIRLDEISKAAKYVELAYNSAKELLNSAIRVHKLKMLKYMPVRWVTKIVRSVAFIVKCFLTLTNNNKQQPTDISQVLNPQTSAILTLSIIPTEDILQTIQKIAIVLREASPDELHLCTRYSTILMYLCSEMKHRSKVSANPPSMTKLDSSDVEDEDDEHQQELTYGQQNDQEFQYYQNNGNFASQPNMTYPTGKDPNQPLPDAVIDWFLKNDESIGLDFVEPWTEMLEQQLDKQKTAE